MAITMKPKYDAKALLEMKNKDLLIIASELDLNGLRVKDSKSKIVLAIMGATEEVDELGLFSQFEVRYVGVHHQQIIHNSNTTKSGEEYSFPRGTWIGVKEIDWYKYHQKVERAVAAEQIPHWDVRRVNPVTTKAKEYFAKAIKALKLKKKPRSLVDLKSLSEENVIKLEGYHVRTIKELCSMPSEWVSQTLGIDMSTTIDILNEAKDAIA